MINVVVSGDYAHRSLFPGRAPYIVTGFSKKKWVRLDSNSVEKYEVKNPTIVDNKTKVVDLAVYFKDGKKSLIHCDRPFYDAIVRACF